MLVPRSSGYQVTHLPASLLSATPVDARRTLTAAGWGGGAEATRRTRGTAATASRSLVVPARVTVDHRLLGRHADQQGVALSAAAAQPGGA